MEISGRSVSGKLGMPVSDSEEIQARYRTFFAAHGHSAAGAGWGSRDRQLLRYENLVDGINLRDRSILDIGGGFGDGFLVARTQKISSYTVVDMSDDHVRSANLAFASDQKFEAIRSDFLSWDASHDYDVVLASGLFNFQLGQMENLNFIKATLEKAVSISKVAFSCNFLSEFIDRPEKNLYYTSLADLIPIVRLLSNRYTISYDFLPFEFTVRIFPRGSINRETSRFREPDVGA